MQQSVVSKKLALVTGAGKRLGLTIARALAEDHLSIVIHAHQSTELAQQQAAILRSNGLDVKVISTDFSTPQAPIQLLDSVTDISGKLPDIVINSAAVYPQIDWTDTNLDQLETTFRINTWLPTLVTIELAKRRQVQNNPDREPGLIINLLDCRINDVKAKSPTYLWSKQMLAQITRCLAVQTAPDLRVNAIGIGLLLESADITDFSRAAAANLLKYQVSSSDLLGCIKMLLTSPAITGQIIYLDGGRHLGSLQSN